MAVELIIKSKEIKDKGIALTHKDQGYSANNRPVSLLMKSNLQPEQLTVDIVKALRQVTVEMSFEEFLERFFCVWSSDAELLAKLLGYETELENEAKENPDDNYLQAWNKDNQKWLEERLSTITLMKAVQENQDNISLVDQFELIKLQNAFEVGIKEYGVEFKDTQNNTEVITKADNKINVKETSVEGGQDITKSQEYLDLMKANEELKIRVEKADEIIKANIEIQKKANLEKAKNFSFVEEAEHDSLVEFMMKSESAPVVTLLEKAQAAIADLQKQVEDVKKEFGEKEHGLDGKVEVENTSPEDVIKANVEKQLKKAKEQANQ